MNHGKKKSSGREASKKQTPLGLVIALAAAGGVVIGSASTYILTRPQPDSEPSISTSAGETPAPQAPPAQTIAMPPQPPFTPPQQQFTPAPQPPGEAPPGKVWSPEHGHWHDAPVPPTFPAPAPSTLTPAATPPPAPAAAPEKKE
jgi:hypothetical protein